MNYNDDLNMDLFDLDNPNDENDFENEYYDEEEDDNINLILDGILDDNDLDDYLFGELEDEMISNSLLGKVSNKLNNKNYKKDNKDNNKRNFFSSKLYTFLIAIGVCCYILSMIISSIEKKNITNEDIDKFNLELKEEIVSELNEDDYNDDIIDNTDNIEIDVKNQNELINNETTNKEIKIPSDKLANINHFSISEDDYDVNLYAGYIYDFNEDGSLEIQTSSGIYTYFLISNTNIDMKNIKNYISKNQKVYLEYDANKYDDNLNCYAYVWLDVPNGDDINFNDLLLNYKLIKDGVSQFEFSKFNKKYLNQLSKAEDMYIISK